MESVITFPVERVFTFTGLRNRQYGPYSPSGGPIPLHRYRKPRSSATQRRADRIGELARKISVPRTALSGVSESLARAAGVVALRSQPFVDSDYASRLDALRGVSDMLYRPLARLADDDLAFVNALVERTLDKAAIEHNVRAGSRRRRCTCTSTATAR